MSYMILPQYCCKINLNIYYDIVEILPQYSSSFNRKEHNLKKNDQIYILTQYMEEHSKLVFAIRINFQVQK